MDCQDCFQSVVFDVVEVERVAGASDDVYSALVVFHFWQMISPILVRCSILRMAVSV